MRPSKRDQLIENAINIFNRNGFHASGMDLIAAESGVSKTSIYKHFRTKDDLIIAVLGQRDEMFINWLCNRMVELADEPLGQLIAMFDALEEWFRTPEFRSCMFIKAASEFQDDSDPIHRFSRQHKQRLEQRITELARQAKLAKPMQIARQLMLLKEGAIVTAHMGITDNPSKDAKQAAKVLLGLN